MNDIYKRMPQLDKELFDTLPSECQQAYLDWWSSRPDTHGAHRDALPAFAAGWTFGRQDVLHQIRLATRGKTP